MTGQSIPDSFDSMTFADSVEGRKSIVIKKNQKQRTHTRGIRTNNRETREIEVAGGRGEGQRGEWVCVPSKTSEITGF